MCALNSMPYIMSSVESFRQQTNVEKELIVIYSDSNDNTEYYLESIKEKNIKKFNFNGSIYESLNLPLASVPFSILSKKSLTVENVSWDQLTGKPNISLLEIGLTL